MNPLIPFGLAGLALLLLTSKSEAKPEPKATGMLDLQNVPLEIATKALKMSGVDSNAQITWLNDNGWTRTATALTKFFSGEASEADVLAIAKDEWSARLTGK